MPEETTTQENKEFKPNTKVLFNPETTGVYSYSIRLGWVDCNHRAIIETAKETDKDLINLTFKNSNLNGLYYKRDFQVIHETQETITLKKPQTIKKHIKSILKKKQLSIKTKTEYLHNNSEHNIKLTLSSKNKNLNKLLEFYTVKNEKVVLNCFKQPVERYLVKSEIVKNVRREALIFFTKEFIEDNHLEMTVSLEELLRIEECLIALNEIVINLLELSYKQSCTKEYKYNINIEVI